MAMDMDLYQLRDSPTSSSSASLASASLSLISGSPPTTPEESDHSDNGDSLQLLEASASEHHGSHYGLGIARLSLQFILVIGGLGYIGSHTSLELLKAGFNVIIVDNLSNSFETVFHRIKKLAADHFCAHGGNMPLLHFHKLDYRSRSMRFLLESYADVVPSSLPSDHLSLNSPSTTTSRDQRGCLIYRSHIAGVIHFAASKSVVDSISRPLHYYRNNVCGLVSLLDLLERYGIRNVVFSSSATIYGTKAEAGASLREDDLVHHPVPSSTEVDTTTGKPVMLQPNVEGLTSPYGRTKYFCEAILADVAAADPAWRIIALRYFNPVSCEPSGLLGEDPRAHPTNLFPVLTQVLTGNRPVLDVYGQDWPTRDGTPIRDFIHVVDVARGHIAALKPLIRRGTVTGQPSFRAYNLGSGHGTTVLEAIRSLESASGRTIPLRWRGRRDGDVGFCVASTERARTELGWAPLESIERCAVDSWNFVCKMTTEPTMPVSDVVSSRGSQSPPAGGPMLSLPTRLAAGEAGASIEVCTEPAETVVLGEQEEDEGMPRTPTPLTNNLESQTDILLDAVEIPLPGTPTPETMPDKFRPLPGATIEPLALSPGTVGSLTSAHFYQTYLA